MCLLAVDKTALVACVVPTGEMMKYSAYNVKESFLTTGYYGILDHVIQSRIIFGIKKRMVLSSQGPDFACWERQQKH